jgi:hypothetical protein
MFISNSEVKPLKMSHSIGIRLDVELILVVAMNHILKIPTLKVRVEAKVGVYGC